MINDTHDLGRMKLHMFSKILGNAFKSDETPKAPTRTTREYVLEDAEVKTDAFKKAMETLDFNLVLDVEMPRAWKNDWDKELAKVKADHEEAFKNGSLGDDDLLRLEYSSRVHYMNMLRIEPTERWKQDKRERVTDPCILEHCLK